MSTLLAAALIECDGHSLPITLFAPIVVVGLMAAPIVWFLLRPLAVWSNLRGGPVEMAAAVIGLFVGAVLGGFLGLLRRTDSAGLVYCLAIVGLVLGWQAACALALWTAALGLPMKALSRRPLPWTAWLALGAMAWIIAWGWLVPISP